MAAKKTTKRSARKNSKGNGRRQREIPGTERKRDKALSDAAEHLYTLRDKRMRMQENESDAAERLLNIMKKKNIEVYVDQDLELRVDLKALERVKVSRFKDDNA